jgi:putative redox protein
MVRATLSGAPYRVQIDAGGHALVADEARARGGGGTGPDPFELVLSGLAACTAITLRMYADRKGWSGFAISAELEHRVEDGRHLIERGVRVAGVPDEAGLERLRDIVERTPVTLALKNGFAIATELSAAAMEGSRT